jgi:hypothetical protein
MSKTIPSEAIREARERSRREAAALQERRAQQEREYEQLIMAKYALLRSFRTARRRDYKQWLIGYLEAGGNITHIYDYPWGRWDWYVPVEDNVELIPLYGSTSIQIIVPVGMTVYGDGGHSLIFWMDGFRAPRVVPIFGDIEL